MKKKNSIETVHRFITRAGIVCWLILFSSWVPIYAQEPGETEGPAAIAPAGQLSLTFEQLGYDTKDLNRDRDTRYYSLYLPGNFEILPAGNYLDLITYHLPAVPDKASVLKVFVNGQLLSSQSLTESNTLSNTVRIALPQDLLLIGYNSIKAVLDTSASCEDQGAIVDVFIHNASSITLGYQQNPYPTDLAFYPWPFFETSLLEIPTVLVLPDSPTAADLSAAATVAAGLGRMSGGAIRLTTTLAGELDPDIRETHHMIVLGTPASNSLLANLELPFAVNGSNLEPGQGVWQEIVSPWNEYRLILIISGRDDEGVSKASQALNRRAHFLSVQGSLALIDELRLAPDETETSRPPNMTLASLGYDDEIVLGAKPQDFTYDFFLPLGWQLEESPSLVLKFAHAQILAPLDSIIDVALNGVPVGSALLDDSNAQNGELTIDLSAHRLMPGRNQLRVGVEMNFPGSTNLEKCKLLADDRAWTVISSESEIFLSYYDIDPSPDLRNFPRPFSRNEGVGQTLLVLPDQPQPAMFDALIRLAIRLGSPTSTEFLSVHVAFASEIDRETWQDYHLVVLGRPTENTLLGQFNTLLPHPFKADSDLLEALVIDSVAFEPDPSRDAGLLQLAESPWNADYSLLAITGTTDQGVLLALNALLEQSEQLQGNLAVIEIPARAETDEPAQAQIYTTDTRPPASKEITPGSPDDATGEPATETLPDGQTISADTLLLADRWWK
ncbi:MAG: cellulose biosynthesis cyclic di-GMP-binding regulatory protein BcsB [Chloroflexota bacterium]